MSTHTNKPEADSRWATPRTAPAAGVASESSSDALKMSETPDTIAGTTSVAADKVARVSVEGRPADGDAKSGPKRLVWEMLMLPLGILVVSVIVSFWLGWVAGLVGVIVGGLALLLNPVLAAAIMRVDDRAEVIEIDRNNTPGA